MTQISPKPIIARTVQTWRVMPGMTFALVEDIQQKLWIVESCPAGTQFWTLAQAETLELGARTREALQQALRAGRALEQERAAQLVTTQQTRRVSPSNYDIPTRYAIPLERQRRTSRTRQTVDNGKALVTV